MRTTRLSLGILIALAGIAFPLCAQISVVSDLSQDREAAPGEAYDGTIVVRNDAKEPQEFNVYQTDYLFSSDGTSTYGAPGSTARSNARWIHFSPAHAVIPPGGTVSVVFTVSVPENAPGQGLVGTYWSMLMVEGAQKEPLESPHAAKGKKAQLGIRTTLRYGVQVATHILHSGTKSVRILQAKLTPAQGGSKRLEVDIEDNGTLGFRPEVYVEVFDSKGQSMGKFPGASARLYPGTSVRQIIDLGKILPGTYKALVVVDAGGEDVFGAQYNLEF